MAAAPFPSSFRSCMFDKSGGGILHILFYLCIFFVFIFIFLLSNMPMCWTQAARIRVQNFAAVRRTISEEIANRR